MTTDQLADLKRQRAEFWRANGDGQAPHNVSAGSVRAKREARRQRERRRDRQIRREQLAALNAGVWPRG